jgi:hypothetical protein
MIPYEMVSCATVHEQNCAQFYLANGGRLEFAFDAVLFAAADDMVRSCRLTQVDSRLTEPGFNA